MKCIFKIFFRALIIGAVSMQIFNTAAVFVKAASAITFRYLFLGLDDAAENTDVLIMVSYNTLTNEAAVLQIPLLWAV